MMAPMRKLMSCCSHRCSLLEHLLFYEGLTRAQSSLSCHRSSHGGRVHHFSCLLFKAAQQCTLGAAKQVLSFWLLLSIPKRIHCEGSVQAPNQPSKQASKQEGRRRAARVSKRRTDSRRQNNKLRPLDRSSWMRHV